MESSPKKGGAARLGVWLPTVALVALAVAGYIIYRQKVEIQEITPEQFQDAYSLCVSFRNQGKIDKAIRICELATKLDAKSEPAWATLGLVYTEKRMGAKAVGALQHALQINPNSANTYNNIGIAYKLAGNIEQAVASYQKAIAISPEHLKAHFNLGNALREQGRYEEAAAEYRIVVAKDPNDGDAFYNLARCDARTKTYAEVITSLNSAIQLNPNFAALAARSPDFENMKDNPEFK